LRSLAFVNYVNNLELTSLLYEYLLVDHVQIRNYINGTIYSFISSSVIFKEECMKIGM
jgi:hypothetical protein